MGSRAHGTWAKVYADVWVHPKTSRLAKSLEGLGVPSRWSLDVSVGQLHRLACRLADTTDDGKLGHLAPQAFCNLIGWSDHRKADAVLAAWLSSGFIDNPGTDHAGLHGFDEMFGELVRKRIASKRRRDEEKQKSRTHDSDTRPESCRPRVARVAPQEIEREINTLPLPTVGVVPPASDGADRIADAWAAECPDHAQPRRPLTRGIRKKLLVAWQRESGRDWADTFRSVHESDFLSGRVPGRNGGQPFCPAIAWCTGPENLAKIDAGEFVNRATVTRIDRTTQLALDATALYERRTRGNAPDEALPLEYSDEG